MACHAARLTDTWQLETIHPSPRRIQSLALEAPCPTQTQGQLQAARRMSVQTTGHGGQQPRHELVRRRGSTTYTAETLEPDGLASALVPPLLVSSWGSCLMLGSMDWLNQHSFNPRAFLCFKVEKA